MDNYFESNVQLLELISFENILNGSKIVLFGIPSFTTPSPKAKSLGPISGS